jgi:uracil phosphoribosyltransferase
MLNLLNHPLLTHKLTLLRRKETGTIDFRETLEEIAGLDEKLNEHGYIVPGLGDAGDRLFGTN